MTRIIITEETKQQPIKHLPRLVSRRSKQKDDDVDEWNILSSSVDKFFDIISCLAGRTFLASCSADY